ncbi:MAG: hypothetical protein ACOX3W_04210 [Christensenellaceae bacterium]|jgi:hypothetical protein
MDKRQMRILLVALTVCIVLGLLVYFSFSSQRKTDALTQDDFDIYIRQETTFTTPDLDLQKVYDIDDSKDGYFSLGEEGIRDMENKLYTTKRGVYAGCEKWKIEQSYKGLYKKTERKDEETQETFSYYTVMGDEHVLCFETVYFSSPEQASVQDIAWFTKSAYEALASDSKWKQ